MVNEPEQTQVWPVWGRVAFWVVFAVVLIIAAVLGFHGRNQGAAIRIAVSVVVAHAVVVVIVGLIKRLTR